MEVPLKLGDNLTLKGAIYQVIGIDTYTLHNQIEPGRQWNSFTLAGSDSRIGLTRIDSDFEIWNSISFGDIVAQQLIFNAPLSGVASVSFQGDHGPSTPISEIVWFNISNDHRRDFVIERFLYIRASRLKKVETFFYLGEKINESDIRW